MPFCIDLFWWKGWLCWVPFLPSFWCFANRQFNVLNYYRHFLYACSIHALLFYYTSRSLCSEQGLLCWSKQPLRCLNLRIRFDKFCCLFWRFCFYFLFYFDGFCYFIYSFVFLFFCHWNSRSLNFLMRGCPLSGDMSMFLGTRWDM